MNTKGKSMSTIEAIENFKKTIKSHSSKEGNHVEIKEAIKKVKGASPDIYSNVRVEIFLKARAKAISELTNRYITAVFSSQYPLLSNEILKLKRYLYLQGEKIIEDTTSPITEKEKGKKIEIPLFAKAEFKNIGATKLDLIKKTKRDPWGGHTTNTITATLPEPPQQVVRAAKNAIGFYHKTISDIYTDDLLDNMFDNIPDPKLNVIWIPAVNTLSIKTEIKAPKRIDPALLLSLGEQNFVVTTWDIEEEKSYEWFLREFSIGNAQIHKEK